MSNYKLEQVTGPLTCGEGPHWDIDRKVLYLVDINSSLVLRYVPETDTVYQAKVDGPTVSLIVPVRDQPDKFVIGLGLDLALITWDGESTTVSKDAIEVLSSFESDRPTNRFNDGKTDPSGRLYAGTMGSRSPEGVWEQGAGALYSLGQDREVKTQLTEIGIANGLAWSTDHKTFYYVDSLAYSIDALDYDEATGDVSNRRKIFDLKENDIVGIADGMTIDTDGNLWVAIFGGHEVIHVNPNTGKLLRRMPIPGKNVTSVAFGGENLDELYVTSATVDTTEEERELTPTNGCTYKITGLGVKGYEGVPMVL